MGVRPRGNTPIGGGSAQSSGFDPGSGARLLTTRHRLRARVGGPPSTFDCRRAARHAPRPQPAENYLDAILAVTYLVFRRGPGRAGTCLAVAAVHLAAHERTRKIIRRPAVGGSMQRLAGPPGDLREKAGEPLRRPLL